MNPLIEKLNADGNFIGMKTRPARALIGWMPEREAQVLLAFPYAHAEPLPEHVERVRAAHENVLSRPVRPGSVELANLFSDTGPQLDQYLATLAAEPYYAECFASGCTVRIVDLSKVCAVQPLVHLDGPGSEGPIQQATGDDLVSLANITLPLPSPVDVPVQYEDARRAWVIRSDNTDLRTQGRFTAQIHPAPGLSGTAFGFCVALPPSVVQVVLYRGRHFLKDGYHRSLGLLRRGIRFVPALFYRIPDSAGLDIDGRFPDEIILGPHPPMLTDYLKEDVAADGLHLAAQKTITIRVVEDTIWG